MDPRIDGYEDDERTVRVRQVTTNTDPDAVETLMTWRNFLNRVVLNPAELEGLDMDDVAAQHAAENRHVAADGLANGFFAPDTPLDTDDELDAAWREMGETWREILDALPRGCRLTYVLEPFLTDHGHEPAYRHHRLGDLGHDAGIRTDTSVVDVACALHEAGARRAVAAARSARGSARSARSPAGP